MAVANLKSISAVKPTRQVGRRSRGRPRRIGLVLAAGGVLGAAWTTGALEVLQSELSVDLAEADVIVGTSAGSVLAAGLRCGLTIADLAAIQRSECPTRALSLAGPDLCGGLFPPLPQFRLGSPQLLLTAARAPRRVHPWVVASACLPLGRGNHDALEAALRQMIAALAQDEHREPLSTPGVGASWPGGGPDLDHGGRL